MKKRFLRNFVNRLLHLLARFLPGSKTLRPFLHRLRGVKIYGSVFIGEEAYLENEHPECIEIHNNVSIGLRSTIISHFKGKGKVIMKKNAWIGPCCTIIAASGEVRTIGEGAVLSAGSVVNRDVPAHTFVAGVPAKPIAKVTVPLVSIDNIADFKKGLKPLRR